jgi:NifU-like protein involved in Fe-S cluster formation
MLATVTEDVDLLYSDRILVLGARIPRTGRLPAAAAHAVQTSPLCGSRVCVDLVTSLGRIADFAQEVRACALGRASAAVLGGHVIGRSRAEILAARDQLRAMLETDGGPPAPPFEELAILRPARAHRSRHAAILLPFEATLAAFDAPDGSPVPMPLSD